jgi:hypothetical protein
MDSILFYTCECPTVQGSIEYIESTEEMPEAQAYVKEMIALFRPYLSTQSDKDLFMGYNVLFRQRFLEFWLANPTGEIEQCDAYKKLALLSDGDNGYLLPLLQL